LAVCIATIERHGIPIITALCAFHYFVTARGGSAGTRLTFALGTDLFLAKLRAAITRRGVAVVTLLGKADISVATFRERAARLPSLGADEPGLDEQAVLVATVVGFSISVVARLLGIDDPVASAFWRRLVLQIHIVDARGAARTEIQIAIPVSTGRTCPSVTVSRPFGRGTALREDDSK
jgi:hypothetical protein